MHQSIAQSWAWTLCLALAISLGASIAAEASESPTPYLELEPGDDVYSAELSMTDFAQPIVTVKNPNPEQALVFQVLSMGAKTRSVVAEVEAGGQMTLTLGKSSKNILLALVARDVFQAEVADLDSRRRLSLEVAHSTGGKPSEANRLPQSCGGSWTLTCIAPADCNFEITRGGEVYGLPGNGYHEVYWYTHTPVASWATRTGGKCLTTWQPSDTNPGCPATSYNCQGELYSISGAVSLE